MKIPYWLIVPVFWLFFACDKEHLPKPVVDPVDTIQTPMGAYKFELIWRKPMDENPSGFVSLAPILSGGDVGIVKMFGGPTNTFTMRDGKTGEIKWTFSDPIDIADGSEITATVAERGKIILSAGNQVYSLNASDGKVDWKYDLNRFQNTCAFPRLQVYDNHIYHGHTECIFPDQKFASFVRCRLDDPQWDTLITLKRENGFSPFLEACNFWISSSGDTMVIFQNRQSSASSGKIDLYSLNLRTREIAWKIENLDPRGGSNVAPPLIWRDKIYFQGFHTVYCIDAPTGAIRWKRIRDQLYEQLLSCNMLLVDNKLILRTNHGHTIALDPNTGGDLWINTQLTGTSDNMVEHNGVIYFTGHKGSVTAIDVKTGEKLATYKSPNAGKWGDANFITELSINPELGYLYASDGYETFCLKAIK